jgi:hypothetical protein
MDPVSESRLGNNNIMTFIKLESYFGLFGALLGAGIWIPGGQIFSGFAHLGPEILTTPFFAAVSIICGIPLASLLMLACGSLDTSNAPICLPLQIAWWKGAVVGASLGLLMGFFYGVVAHPVFQGF